MGRQTRLKPTEERPLPADRVADLTPEQKTDREAVRLDCTADSMIDAIDAALADGMVTPAMVNSLANMRRANIAQQAEHRQKERHARDMVAAMTPEQRHRLVAEYLRELDYDGRAIFREILAELDEDGGLLS